MIFASAILSIPQMIQIFVNPDRGLLEGLLRCL